jgi:hypothetical protein
MAHPSSKLIVIIAGINNIYLMRKSLLVLMLPVALTAATASSFNHSQATSSFDRSHTKAPALTAAKPPTALPSLTSSFDSSTAQAFRSPMYKAAPTALILRSIVPNLATSFPIQKPAAPNPALMPSSEPSQHPSATLARSHLLNLARSHLPSLAKNLKLRLA